MITITLLEDSNGAYKGFISEGHAGYADHGSDIVCAAVSILVMNTINAIETYTRDVIEVENDEKEGFIAMHFDSEISSEASLLMDALVLGLSGVEDQYGDYVRILIQEV
jgi:uncharacterized protein YsxB (DUF464 family)